MGNSKVQVLRRESGRLDKHDFVLRRTAGKSVLDVGCVDHTLEHATALGERWLHERLRESASEVVGIDLERAEVDALRAAGYDVLVADAEDFHLERTFDVIVAGDIIEHLGSPARFLESAQRHMHQESELIITTPNPFNIEQSIRLLSGRSVAVHTQHTCWFDPVTLGQLLDRSGFRVTEFVWLDTDYFQIHNPVGRAIGRAVARFRPSLGRDFGVVATTQ